MKPHCFFMVCSTLAVMVALCFAADPETASMPLAPRVVALTFDDGPSALYTPQILDILKKNGVHATFFVIGENVEKYPALVKREVDEGNCVGNHTWSHPLNAPLESKKHLVTQILRTDSAVFNAAGVHTSLLRPPHGWESPWMVRNAEALGYNVVTWTVDPKDWRHPSANVIIKRVERANGKSAIVLLHDGLGLRPNPKQGNTLKALQEIIDDFKSRGYAFVTIEQLVRDPDLEKQYRGLFRVIKEPAKGRPY
jgi:peptidoglycan/xylan/chitin deacetylase (PgdA/CDA1 family)